MSVILEPPAADASPDLIDRLKGAAGPGGWIEDPAALAKSAGHDPVYAWDDVDAHKNVYFKPSRRDMVFHYALFCHQIGNVANLGLARTCRIGAVDRSA